ncbi:splicing factor, CC1-like protein [Polychaeton citri CBS 116435]|uniref:Splicing factor, CC1-like protein n=1 Tax=Polychaeton citri CBS 116435 TaxID=1314669 RepID=A0A9P4Q078_9PEZI|nr:splicing factor, CC1-like protein [Polychaeton citri CBS 116435]
MANPVQSVEELLEQAERLANSSNERKKHAQAAPKPKTPAFEEQDFIPLPAYEDSRPSRDPRRNGNRRSRYSEEREENNERRARRSREIVSDDAASEVGSANGSRSSKRGRTRSPHNARRRHDRDSYRDRGDDRWPPRSRRSRDRDEDEERHWRPEGRSRRDEDHADRPPTRDGRDKARSGRDEWRPRDRERRRSPEPKRQKTPEPTDDERDRRTVFVQQLAARLRTKDLISFFQAVGEVKEAQIVKDRVSGRSKGVGYVEFKDEDSVQKAIQLTGQKLMGIPIIAQLTEAEKNRQARAEPGTSHSNGVPFHRLYVGNIHFSITEQDLQNVFEPFGDLEFVQLQKDEQARSRGYGFVQFVDPMQAKEALEKMNGFELAGRPIRVGLGNDKFTPESTQNLLQRFGSQHQQGLPGASFSGMGGRGAHAGGTGNFDRAGGRDPDKTGGASALDDTDVAGVNFSNYSRESLMKKLARTDEPEEKIAPKTQPKPTPVAEPQPSRCIILKNVYNEAEESEPNWKSELRDDVGSECTSQYGKVVHIDIPPASDDGEVYMKFDTMKSAQNAFRGLNGRYFGGKVLTAQYVVDAVYHMNFPKAQNL